jgi:hypothetical protein
MAHPLLEYYVKKAEEMGMGINLTLCVNGLIVEGVTTSQRSYYEEIWTVLTSAKSANESNREQVDIVNSSLHDFIELEEEKEKTQDSVPEYIYLRKVKIHSGSTEDFIMASQWVGRLSSVDAFSIGTFRKDD